MEPPQAHHSSAPSQSRALPVVSYDQNQQTPTPTFTGVSTGQWDHPHMNNYHGHRQPWSTGLCDCCKDPKICCLTWWCPCITFGRIAEIVDRGSTSCGVSGSLYALLLWVFGCSCMYSCMYRSKMRGQFFLEEKPCNDCCVHCWCESCSLCQEYRELQNRGFNLSIGWHGNVERHRRMEQMHPVVPDGMHR